MIKNISHFVRDISVFHPHVCHLLVIHLPHFPNPIPFIETMPTMFCVAPASLVQEAALQLHVLAESDSHLLLPVIAALSEFPLAISQQQMMLQMAEDAVDIIDESDLPVLCRILLKSICPYKSERIILKIRREMSQVSDASSALLIEALWEVLPSSPIASELLLDQITREQELYKYRHPSLADLSIVLILTTNANIGILKIRARRLLQTWLHQGVFPFHQLELILSLRRSNEIWSRMVPAVWRLCLWTLEALSDLDIVSSHSKYQNDHINHGSSSSNHGLRRRNRVITTSTSGGTTNNVQNLMVSQDGCVRNREGLAWTIQCLYENVPSMRETIVSNLLGMCYAVSSVDGYGSGHGRIDEGNEDNGAWLFSSIPPLGAAAMEYGIFPVGLTSSTTNGNRYQQPTSLPSMNGNGNGSALNLWRLERNFRSQRHRATMVRTKIRTQAQLAAAILEGLSVATYPEVGASVLASLTHRLHTCGEGGKVNLPPPTTLHTLMKCIVSGTASSPQMENTVFIIIQKLLAAAQLSSTSSLMASELSGGLPLGVSDDTSLLSTLGFDMTVTHSYGRYLGVNGDIGGMMVGSLSGASPMTISSSSLMQYSPGTVGCLLAGHMMLRGTRHSTTSRSKNSSSDNDRSSTSSSHSSVTTMPSLSTVDAKAVLTWLSRAICPEGTTIRGGSGRLSKPALSDMSLVYAIDAFVACLENKQMQMQMQTTPGDDWRMLTESTSSSSSSSSSSQSSSSNNNSGGNSLTKDLVIAALNCYEVVTGGASALVAMVNLSDTDENGNPILPPRSMDDERKCFLARLDSCNRLIGHQEPSSRNSSRTIVWRITYLCDNITANIVMDIDKVSAVTGQHTNARHIHTNTTIKASSGRQNEGTSAVTGTAMTRQRLVSLAALSIAEVRAATTATAYAMLWAVQRLASLHMHLYSLDEKSIGSMVTAVQSTSQSQFSGAVSAMIELSVSELNAPEKRPWVVDGLTAAIDPIPSVAAASASSSTRRRRREVVANSESTSTTEGVCTDLHVWACSAADGVEGLSFIRSASISATEALHLAWERYKNIPRILSINILAESLIHDDITVHNIYYDRALAAAVLLSHTVTATYDPNNDATIADPTPLIVLSQVLCQIHMSRLMLRAAHAGNGSSQQRGGTSRYSATSSASKGNNRSRTHVNEDRNMCGGHEGNNNKTAGVGMGAARSATSDAMRAWGHDTATTSKEDHERFLDTSRRAHENQIEVFETHKFTLQRLLNRLERLISTDCLLAAVTCLLPTTMLTTDAGLSIISRFVMSILDGDLRDVRREVKEPTNRRNNDDVECDNGDDSGADGIDLLMTSVAASVSGDPDELFVPLMDICKGSTAPHAVHLAENLQCQLLTLIPKLFIREEQLRKANVPLDLAWATTGSKKNKTTTATTTPMVVPVEDNRPSFQPTEGGSDDSSSASMEKALSGRLGATLDRQGCAVFLLILIALLESTVQYARLNAGGDLSEMASNAFLQRVSHGIVTGTHPFHYHLSIRHTTYSIPCNLLTIIAFYHCCRV